MDPSNSNSATKIFPKLGTAHYLAPLLFVRFVAWSLVCVSAFPNLQPPSVTQGAALIKKGGFFYNGGTPVRRIFATPFIPVPNSFVRRCVL